LDVSAVGSSRTKYYSEKCRAARKVHHVIGSLLLAHTYGLSDEGRRACLEFFSKIHIGRSMATATGQRLHTLSILSQFLS
jgi:hypothetical protein